MRLCDIIASVADARLAARPSRDAWQAVVRGLTPDPLRVTQGAMFVCLNDRARGNPFESFTAVERGATAVLCEPGAMVPAHVTRIEVADSQAAFARAADAFFGHPSRALSVIGVTADQPMGSGTRRRSTNVAWLITELMRMTGSRPARLTELGCSAGGRELPQAVSELDAFEIQQLLATHQRAGGTACVVEVNAPKAEAWREVSFALEVGEFADPVAGDAFSWRGSRLGIGARTVFTPLIGPANAAALRTALEALAQLSFASDRIVGALPSVEGTPGFLEPVRSGQPFGVFVDAASTAAELAELIAEARQLTHGRVILVTGSPASVSHAERTQQGLAAASADLVFATSDNPGHELPDELIRGLTPVSAANRFIAEPDRHLAIMRAIRSARANDVVLLCGKGHRRVQEIGGAVLPFDDRAHAFEALARCGFGGAEV